MMPSNYQNCTETLDGFFNNLSKITLFNIFPFSKNKYKSKLNDENDIDSLMEDKLCQKSHIIIHIIHFYKL